MKINNFQGELTDISAKNEALVLQERGGPRGQWPVGKRENGRCLRLENYNR